MLNLMIAGTTNQQMAALLQTPLSTIQRRSRILEHNKDVITTHTFNYKKYGYKIGLLHIYLRNGNSEMIAEKILKITSISCVSIHIGNSDIVAKYACKNAQEMLELLSAIKKVDGVDRTVWSEQVKELKDTNKLIHF
jgi:hypothetical protein